MANKMTISKAPAQRFTASDFHLHYRPAKCDLRLFLHSRGEPEDAASPYDEVIKILGQRHEKAHLVTFDTVVDISSVDQSNKEARTQAAIAESAGVIYQPFFRSRLTLLGEPCDVVGQPDFLISSTAGYIIRDVKLARRINEKDHPEIIRQLQLYAWLFEQTTGNSAAALQVLSGTGELVPIDPADPAQLLADMEAMVSIRRADSEPYSPVGWSKCGNCVFNSRCWLEAERTGDVAMVAGVDQGLALELRSAGTTTAKDLVANFDANRLSELQRPWGTKRQRVGKSAASILTMAQAMIDRTEILLERTDLPGGNNCIFA